MPPDGTRYDYHSDIETMLSTIEDRIDAHDPRTRFRIRCFMASRLVETAAYATAGSRSSIDVARLIMLAAQIEKYAHEPAA